MALADVRHELVHILAQTHDAQREERDALSGGSDFEKVRAAGELNFLGRQEAMLKGRLAELDRRIDERRALFSWFRQAWFNLTLHFESWIAHG